MTEPALGRIQEIQIRDVWQLETDFSKWLALPENLSLLGKLLDINLVDAKTEQYIPPYRADIICAVQNRDAEVVIENQFGCSDHDHLGKYLTYISSEDHDVGVAIWIAETFTQPHIDAVNAQNKCENSIDHYAVTVQLLQIDDSLPAPRFKILAEPENRKLFIEDTPEKKKRRSSYKELWRALDSYLKDNGGYAQLDGQPTGRNWIGIKTKAEELQLRPGYSFPKKQASLTFWFEGKERELFFHQLKSKSAVLEGCTDQNFSWWDNGLTGEDFSGGGKTVRSIDFEQEGLEAISTWYLKTAQGVQATHDHDEVGVSKSEDSI